MWQLSLPSYPFNVKKNNGQWNIFDIFRKKFVRLSPEEWVRQHFLHYLINEKGYPASLIAVEQQIDVNGLKKRCDAVLYNYRMEPQAILEFKAPQVKISSATFDQAAVYNSVLKIEYYFLSNGSEHYFVKLSSSTKSYNISTEIPTYEALTP